MIFLLTHLFFVLIPGFLLITVVGIRRSHLLYSVTFSFATLVGLVFSAYSFGWSVDHLLIAYAVLVGILITILLCRKTLIAAQINALKASFENKFWLYGLITVVISYLAWYLYAGPYTEVPSDMYRHFEYAKVRYELIQQNVVGAKISLAKAFNQGGSFWYVLIALGAHISGTALIDVVYPMMLINGLIFIVGIYVFSHALYQVFDFNRCQLAIAAVLTCAFISLQMGVISFGFIGYYSTAPVILNYLIYLASILCFMQLLGQHQQRNTRIIVGNLAALILCIAVAMAIHKQEALFAVAMMICTGAWIMVDKFIITQHFQIKRYLIGVTVIAVGLAIVAIFWVSFFNQAFIPKPTGGKIVGLPLGIPDFGPLHILNPYYQFYHVVTIWGLFVALLFMIDFNFLRKQPIIIAGMLSPFLTVFNPIFVDLYLRVETYLTLWRLCYLIPVYYVAALFIVRRGALWRQYGWIKKLSYSLIIAGLFLLIIPTPIAKTLNPNVRLSNQPLAAANSYDHWHDLLGQLNLISPKTRVLTDPVTGYVVSALTPHRTYRYKFLPSRSYHAKTFVFDDYSDFPLSRYRGWLMIVNQRHGAMSETGRIARHWSEEIMQLSRFYPQNLIEHLQAHPDRFEVLWENNAITLYKIRK